MICLACNNTKSKDVELTLEGDTLEMFNFVCCLEITQPEETQGICNYCVEELKVSFNFKKRCLEIFANIFENSNNAGTEDHQMQNEEMNNFMDSILGHSLHEDNDSVNFNDLLIPFIPEVCYGVENPANSNSLSVLDVSDQKCRYCFEEFPSKEECQLHLEEHKGDDKPYKCPHEGCGSSFKARKNLKDHYLVHSNERPFPCHFCQQTFKSSSNRSKHERRIHTKERIAMKEAETRAEIKKNEQKNGGRNVDMQPSSSPSPPASTVIPLVVSTPANLVQSEEAATATTEVNNKSEEANDKGDRMFQCEHQGCTSSFRTKSSLRDHSKVHSDERPYICNYCSSAFKSSSNRSKHERGSHSEQYQKRKFEREAERNKDGSSNLSSSFTLPTKRIKYETDEHKTEDMQHQTINASLSPPTKRISFPCRYCDRVFKKIESRDKHETTHKDFLAYDCGYCYKNFKSQELLKEHMKIHIEQTKFPCTYKNCNEIFSDRRSLRAHKSTHDPEEFICEVESCGRIFSSFKSLKSHKAYTKHYTNLNDSSENQETEIDEHVNEIECDICMMKFDRDKLAEHLKLHI